MKLSFKLFLLLAAGPCPASPFSIVFMQNYMNNLGSPGQNSPGGGPRKKPPPKAPAQSGPPNYLSNLDSTGVGPSGTPSALPPLPLKEEPPMTSATAPAAETVPDEVVMQAMNELTDTFMKNEQATLLALKEISASLQILAAQKTASRQAPLPPAVAPPAPPQPIPQPLAPPPQPAVPAVVSQPLPVAAPSPPTPVPVAVTPKPAPPAPAPAKPTLAYTTTTVASSSVGNYLDSIGGGAAKGKPQVKPSTFKPTPKKPGPASSGAAGSYLGTISSGAPRDRRTSPTAGSKDARSLAEDPIDDGEGMIAGTFVTLTLAGIGLLWALTTGDFSGGDGTSSSSNTVMDLPKVSIPDFGKSDTIKFPSSDSIAPVVPEKPAAPEVKASPPEESTPDAKSPEVPPADKSPVPPATKVPEPENLAPETAAPEEPATPPPEAKGPEDPLAASQPAPEAKASEALPAAATTVPNAEVPPAPAAPKQGLGAKLEDLKESLKESLAPAAPVVPGTPAVPAIPAPAAARAGVIASAAGQAGAVAAQAQAATEAPIKAGTPFNYDPNAKEGPLGWSLLTIEGNQCGGNKQSPIAIATKGCSVDKSFQFTANDKCLVSNLDYTLGRGGPKATFTKDCNGNLLKIPVLEGNFEALQFHTHIGSEHVIGGKRYGAELHVVHKEVSGDRFAVVGIMINGDAKADNPLFGRLLKRWEAVEQKVATSCDGAMKQKSLPFSSDASFNVYDLIPVGTSFYHYDGSLTTPPCSEVVWWEVADKPLSVSAEQYKRLVQLTTTYTDPITCEVKSAASPLDGSTNRPVAQDLNGRDITRICPADGFVAQTTTAAPELVLLSTRPSAFVTIPSDGSRITKDLPGEDSLYSGM